MSSVGGNNRLSLIECKKTSTLVGEQFTDEQIIKIRDWLYHMADIAIEAYEMENQQNHAGEIKNKDKP